MRESTYRVLFLLSILWGALIFWVAPHPPMIDLPQHAGQVALLKEMILGQSPWADQFRINLFTPYIIGYGLALPLSFVMSVDASLKLLMSLSYIAFVFMCVRLRRQYGGDPRLDWFFLLSFFGFAYTWGFLTFLVAAPIGLWFILLTERFADQRTASRGIALIAVGLLTLASHGMIFGFAWGVGAALLAVRMKRFKALLAAIWPFVILALTCIAYFWINRRINAELQINLQPRIEWNFDLIRRLKAPLYAIAAGTQRSSSAPFWLLVAFMAAVPWLMGLRIEWRNRSNWVAFAIVVLILAFVPYYAYDSSYLYERFTLFLAPAYAWMFISKSPAAGATGITAGRGRLARFYVPLMALVCWTMLGVHTVRAWNFGQESADFNAVLSALEPGQRALSLIFDRHSEAANTYGIYLHYPLWYQAEKSGFVDFNFAWFPPQIVRYQPQHLPMVEKGFEWYPEGLDWKKHGASNYRYFIVRHQGPLPKEIFKGADCPPVPTVTSGSWTVFERKDCPVLKQAGG
ncbi:hypothetical protein [Noviherbaspirillum sp.]|uniref:hypothetical protein n=1 Tax=Noviherbaspirillum sp. TaxID=1926288 RepID=UPI002FE24D22